MKHRDKKRLSVRGREIEKESVLERKVRELEREEDSLVWVSN